MRRTRFLHHLPFLRCISPHRLDRRVMHDLPHRWARVWERFWWVFESSSCRAWTAPASPGPYCYHDWMSPDALWWPFEAAPANCCWWRCSRSPDTAAKGASWSVQSPARSIWAPRLACHSEWAKRECVFCMILAWCVTWPSPALRLPLRSSKALAHSSWQPCRSCHRSSSTEESILLSCLDSHHPKRLSRHQCQGSEVPAWRALRRATADKGQHAKV